MHIREVAFDGFDDPDGAGWAGTVSLIAEDGRIEVALRAPQRLSPWAQGLRRRLVARAASLVGRMPEYREGAAELSFDEALSARLRNGAPGP